MADGLIKSMVALYCVAAAAARRGRTKLDSGVFVFVAVNFIDAGELLDLET